MFGKFNVAAKLLLPVILIGVAIGAAVAEANHTVGQKDRIFSPGELTVRKGDTVTFLNDDFYGHNVYSETPGFAFDVGLQPPEEKRSISFDKTGVVDVRCRIHPRMRLTITVKD